MNLHYKAEMAFDRLEEALLDVQQHANPDECSVYASLLDNIIGARDSARRSLTDLCIKKAAPAVGATEAAKNDSDKESNSSVVENGENVKPRACFKVNIYPDSHVECGFDADTGEDCRVLFENASEMLFDLFTMAKAYSVLGGAK